MRNPESADAIPITAMTRLHGWVILTLILPNLHSKYREVNLLVREYDRKDESTRSQSQGGRTCGGGAMNARARADHTENERKMRDRLRIECDSLLDEQKCWLYTEIVSTK
jgi:hypothetical protein